MRYIKITTNKFKNDPAVKSEYIDIFNRGHSFSHYLYFVRLKVDYYKYNDTYLLKNKRTGLEILATNKKEAAKEYMDVAQVYFDDAYFFHNTLLESQVRCWKFPNINTILDLMKAPEEEECFF